MANKEIRILVNKIEGKEPCTITVQDYAFPAGTKVKLKSNSKKVWEVESTYVADGRLLYNLVDDKVLLLTPVYAEDMEIVEVV